MSSLGTYKLEEPRVKHCFLVFRFVYFLLRLQVLLIMVMLLPVRVQYSMPYKVRVTT